MSTVISKDNLVKLIKDDYYLRKNYDKIEFTYIKDSEFSYTLDKLQFINTFKIFKKTIEIKL